MNIGDAIARNLDKIGALTLVGPTMVKHLKMLKSYHTPFAGTDIHIYVY